MSAAVLALQGRLKAAGHDPGPIDGARGPKTYAALCGYIAERDLAAVGLVLGRGITAYCAGFSDLELAHFLSQGAHETQAFRYFAELGGPIYCARYDFRADLGNTEHGDGYRFKGRGLFQLTGRANYEHMAKQTGVDLVARPELAADPDFSVRLAVLYWRERGLSPLACNDDCEAVTRKINGGLNGFLERQRYLARAKTMLRP
jgi:putative chitinase